MYCFTDFHYNIAESMWGTPCVYIRERVSHSQPVYIPSISDKRSKSGKAGQWDSGIHLVYISSN